MATMTMQLGVRPLALHLMFMNFSMPMSAPKPACMRPLLELLDTVFHVY